MATRITDKFASSILLTQPRRDYLGLCNQAGIGRAGLLKPGIVLA